MLAEMSPEVCLCAISTIQNENIHGIKLGDFARNSILVNLQFGFQLHHQYIVYMDSSRC